MAHNYSSAILGLCECLVCGGAIATTVSYFITAAAARQSNDSGGTNALQGFQVHNLSNVQMGLLY